MDAAAPTPPPGSPAPFGLSRRERIMDELRRTGSVRVSDLARELGVAELTIRRDIGELADRGLLTRVHGGATLRSRLDTTVPQAAPTAGPPLFRVGMVVPSLSYYWPHIIIGARAAATDGGVQLVLRGASYSVEDQRRQITSLVESGTLHGLIVATETSGPEGSALLNWLDALPIPVVLAERRVPSSLALTHLEWVTTDHVFGGVLAANHLASLGHRRVGLITSPGSPTSWQLRRGWARATEELGMTPTLDLDTALDSIDAQERAKVIDGLLEQRALDGDHGPRHPLRPAGRPPAAARARPRLGRARRPRDRRLRRRGRRERGAAHHGAPAAEAACRAARRRDDDRASHRRTASARAADVSAARAPPARVDSAVHPAS